MRLFVLVMILFLCTGAAFAKPGSEPGCFELLEKRCQSCHYLSRVCQVVGERSERRWKATLNRMVKRRGAELTQEEQKKLLECLAAPDPSIIQGCKPANSSRP